jgi:hypothetical protein
MIFDHAGNMIQAWGDWDVMPSTPHSCAVDHDNNVWISANGDGMVQKYTYEGKLLLQIGTKGVFDTADGGKRGPGANAAHDRLNKPAGIALRSGKRRCVFCRWLRQPSRGGVR